MITTIQAFKESLIKYPKLMYHGSNQKFDNFANEHIGKNFNASTLGFYFSQYIQPPPYSSTAKEYAEEMVRRHGGEPYIYTCELSYNKPLILDSNGYDQGSAYCIDSQRNDIKNWLKQNSYDAILCYDFQETEFKYQDNIVVVFKPEQIKILKCEIYSKQPFEI